MRTTTATDTWNTIPAKTAEAVLAVRDALARENVTFTPIPKQPVRLRHEPVELAVPSIRNVALRAHRPVSTKAAPTDAVALLHVDDAGYLNSRVYAAATAIRDARNDGLVVVATDEPSDARTYVGTLNKALVLPTRIDGVPILDDVLRDVVSSFPSRTCLDPDAKLDWVASRNYAHVGNNVRRIGMTVEEYIHVDYAWRMTRHFGPANRGVTYVGYTEPIYATLDTLVRSFRNPNGRARDPWARDRVDTQGLPFDPPDPAAYDILTRVGTPALERAAGNNDTSTFDFVRIRLGLKSLTTEPNRRATIKRHAGDIVKIALAKIARNKAFQRRDVPLQFLRVAESTITTDNELELLFELRER